MLVVCCISLPPAHNMAFVINLLYFLPPFFVTAVVAITPLLLLVVGASHVSIHPVVVHLELVGAEFPTTSEA